MGDVGWGGDKNYFSEIENEFREKKCCRTENPKC